MSDLQLNFEAKDKTLKDILFGSNKYCVPRYQRPYAWDIEQISEFWEDLLSSSEPYFLGSLIFNKEDEESTGFLDIIDGQQRLLTATIFVAVLRDIAKNLDERRAGLYQRQDIALEDRLGKQSYRIVPSETLQEFFVQFVQSGEADIKEANPRTLEETKVKRNYEYFYEKIDKEIARFSSKERKAEELDILRNKVANLIVIGVEISREEDAYEIFETTNARGVDLSVGDLLKNLIFKNIPIKDDRDLAKEIWLEITNNVEATSTELKRFIRYFWISRFEFVYDKKVYRDIKKKTTDWQKLLQDIWDDSCEYNRLLEGNDSEFRDLKHGYKIFDSVFALRLMGVSQSYILLLCLMRNFDKLGTDPTRIFQLIENFTFQYTVICRLPSNRVERLYSGAAINIENAIANTPPKKLPGRIQAIFSHFENELNTIAPSFSVFQDAFSDFGYRNSTKRRMLVKYVLGKMNGYMMQTDEYRIDFDRVNIEHVLPQKPNREWSVTEREVKEYVDLLGNLTLLSRVINSKIQNGVIKSKLPELSKSELPLTQRLVLRLKENDLSWGRELIMERQAYLADLAYQHIWKIGK
jgi:uncharacterized protein with ParB-like and HNH nuclease domain